MSKSERVGIRHFRAFGNEMKRMQCLALVNVDNRVVPRSQDGRNIVTPIIFRMVDDTDCAVSAESSETLFPFVFIQEHDAIVRRFDSIPVFEER